MSKKKKTNRIAEEKAFDYQRALGMIDSVSDDHVIARRMGFYDGFIAGAEWQYQKDRYEFAKLKAKEWMSRYDEGLVKAKEEEK